MVDFSRQGSAGHVPAMFQIWYDTFCQCVALGEYMRAISALAQMDFLANTELTCVIVIASYEVLLDAMLGRKDDGYISEN